jgi:hypothetical protein
MTAWQAASVFLNRPSQSLLSDPHRGGGHPQNADRHPLPFSLWELIFMAFGLKNTAQALQHLKDNILTGLDYIFTF